LSNHHNGERRAKVRRCKHEKSRTAVYGEQCYTEESYTEERKENEWERTA